ncbi:hypothetical protein C8R43DRAFT_941740 [Mycena crocata]|nr:hypothetical protein C8R43DRAFT_941740 [Mycena crocata]
MSFTIWEIQVEPPTGTILESRGRSRRAQGCCGSVPAELLNQGTVEQGAGIDAVAERTDFDSGRTERQCRDNGGLGRWREILLRGHCVRQRLSWLRLPLLVQCFMDPVFWGMQVVVSVQGAEQRKYLTNLLTVVLYGVDVEFVALAEYGEPASSSRPNDTDRTLIVGEGVVWISCDALVPVVAQFSAWISGWFKPTNLSWSSRYEVVQKDLRA